VRNVGLRRASRRDDGWAGDALLSSTFPSTALGVDPSTRLRTGRASGSTADVSKEGKFSTTIELAAGEQVIEDKASAPDGSETVVARALTVSTAVSGRGL
jgi:hypothetical protein